jgi:hypothetical protein
MKLTSDQRKINLLISHINYFDRPSSKYLFYSLKNLQAVVKNQHESHIFIKEPTFYNSKLNLIQLMKCSTIFLEMKFDLTLSHLKN